MDREEIKQKVIETGRSVLNNDEAVKTCYLSAYNFINGDDARKLEPGEIESLVLMVNMLKDYLLKDYTNISKTSLYIAVGAIAYTLLPFDLIPDKVPIAGMIDDGVVIGFASDWIKADLVQYKIWREVCLNPKSYFNVYLDSKVSDNPLARKMEISKLAASYTGDEETSEISRAIEVVRRMTDESVTD